MTKLITSFRIKILFLAFMVLLVPLSVNCQQIIYQDAGRIVRRIDRPEVRQRRTEYPQITFDQFAVSNIQGMLTVTGRTRFS